MADDGTVQVIDPAHPLFGRCFAVHSISRPAQGLGHVFVIYQDDVRLRIRLAATDLSPCPLPAHRTKFTLESIRQFVALTQECAPPCSSNPLPSGTGCPRP